MIEQLEGTVVGLDTAPLIYLIERHPVYHPLGRPFFLALDKGQFSAVTSTVTLVEVLVHPLRRNEGELVNRYRDILLHAEYLTMLNVGPVVATLAAELRAEHGLRTPDALQLATALHAGADYFLTNDRELQGFSPLEVLLVDNMEP